MSIIVQVFPHNPYAHWGKCSAEGVEKREDDYGADHDYATGTVTCRECRTLAHVVDVDGTAYVNWPGGTVTSRQTPYGPMVFSETHVGLVLATREENYHDDSDFYALVWNPEAQRIERVGYATTRGGGTDNNRAQADLSDEYKADVDAYVISRWVETLKAQERDAWLTAANEALTPERGSTVRVVKGRKVPVGTIATVFWKGIDEYKTNRWGTYYRVGLRLEDGSTVYTSMDNVEVIVDPDDLPYIADFTKTDEERLAQATAIVARSGAVSAYLGATWVPRAGMRLVA